MLTPLEKKQADLEQEMALKCLQYHMEKNETDRRKGAATRIPSVKCVMDAAIINVQKGLEEFLEEAFSGKAGRRQGAAASLQDLSTSEIAYLSVKMILDCLAFQIPMTALAVRIGREIELEHRLRRFKVTHPDAYREVTEVLDHQTSSLIHRKKVYRAALTSRGAEGLSWPESQCCRVGLKLIEIMIQKTGLIEVTIKRQFRRTTSYVGATQRFLDWLDQMDSSGSLVTPNYWPTLIPPKKWTSTKGGGYFTDEVAPLKLVKTRCKEHIKRLENADLTNVIEGINCIQETPWSINQKVLEVVSALQQFKHSVSGLPLWEDSELPIRPIDIDTNKASLKQWKRQAAKVYAANIAETSKRLQVLRILVMARKFSQYDRFYFPYQTDFRGRIYAVPQTLNPQGSDLSKALLHFADGDEIDSPEAELWFFVHGANCFGIDKVTFEQRKQWVKDNEAEILKAAHSPLDNKWWMEADEPFCFLAWAFEYAEYMKDPNFKSKIPIAMDGSCNGLQHYSAMLRDPIGAKATNVIATDAPQDIYQEVANVVISNLKTLAEGSEKDAYYAKHWQNFPIDRKITKRPVMVLPYGGTKSSCQKYVLDAVTEKLNNGVQWPFSDDELFPASVWLGGRVWDAISEVVIGARLAMEWLKTSTRLLTKHKLPVCWTSPSGFPVVQAYPAIRKYRIVTILCGHRFDPRMTEEIENTIDGRRQQNAIAPNFVHSYDAAALIRTVLKAKTLGITKYAMIHDSYGTTAKYSAQLAQCLREAFAEIYDNKNVLMDFFTEAIPDELKSELTEPPFVGGFSVSEVKNSRYFFA